MNRKPQFLVTLVAPNSMQIDLCIPVSRSVGRHSLETSVASRLASLFFSTQILQQFIISGPLSISRTIRNNFPGWTCTWLRSWQKYLGWGCCGGCLVVQSHVRVCLGTFLGHFKGFAHFRIALWQKMTGGTPEVRSIKSNLIDFWHLTFDLIDFWHLTFDLIDFWHLTFDLQPMDQWNIGTLYTQSAYCDKIVPR